MLVTLGTGVFETQTGKMTLKIRARGQSYIGMY